MGCVHSQAQRFPKRTLGMKHLVSFSTVTLIAKGRREKGAWGKPGRSAQSPLPVQSQRTHQVPQLYALATHVKCCLPGKHFGELGA